MWRRRGLAFLLLVALAGAALAPLDALARGTSNVAALQVALRASRLYTGTVDGIYGPGTRGAVRALQRRAGIATDGVLGRRTRQALGRRGRPLLGARTLGPGSSGWDVAAAQFLLAWHGFPSSTFDGGFGSHVEGAVLRFQRWARLPTIGVIGPATLAALRGPVPRSLLRYARPVAAPVGDFFGPRAALFHPGLDFPAPAGARVRAGHSGRVIFAGWDAGGYGNLVIVRSAHGMKALYAHLSAILVRPGERVGAGALLGRVGATGLATGPHLHFELRVHGAAVDPLPALR